MSEIPTVSSAELAARRQHLRSQRRWRTVQLSWQTLAVAGMTAGLVWLVSLPDWMLRSSNQVTVEGNKSLSPETIRALLPIQYPQFLLTLRPETIVHHLESQAPIAEASVSRRLFPPSLTIRIQERYPVVTVYEALAPANQAGGSLEPTAFLDERGTIIPYKNYMALHGSRPLPTLKLIGIQDSQRAVWATIYQQISRSPVKISELDWRDPANLILKTELGAVHLGSYSSRFPEQLQTLDRMRDVSKQIDLTHVAYIDLTNPDTPLLKIAGASLPAGVSAGTTDDSSTSSMEPDLSNQSAEENQPAMEPETP
ncbi:MAG TPA: FtsQ-type POTRA domain-containing protein [Trichocoleus sp.]